MNHYIKRCVNGHVLEQCKCLGPKQEIVVDVDDCPICLENEETDGAKEAK